MATPFRQSTGLAYFDSVPVSAVVLNNMITERLAGMPLIDPARIVSQFITILLILISAFGFYEIGTLLSPAHNHAAAPATATTAPALKPAVQTAKSLPRSLPTSVVIPSIGVNANVLSVGQDDKGSIDVPGPLDVGWYNLSPTPGEIGPAILVGHVDYVTIGPAVFWSLRDMQPGATIQVARQDGTNVAFTVEKVASYDQENLPTDQIYGNINYPGLRLITCTGDFNYVTHHYSNNLVVYARAQL